MATPMEIDISRPFHWGFNPFKAWDDECLVEQSQYDRRSCLRLFCTQLPPAYTPAHQKRIISEWCDFFRRSSPVEELIVDSRTPIDLFEAICEHRSITRLRIKWGPVSDLTPITKLKNLKAIYLGTTGVRDVSPLARLKKLTYLDLNNFKHVVDFVALSNLRSLEFLRIQGYPQGPQKIRVKSLDFVGALTKLRALKIGFVKIDQNDVTPLLRLSRLEFLVVPRLPDGERDRILATLPKLKYGNVKPGKPVRTQLG